MVLAVGLVLGANALAFLCDDAFIIFRYVSNARAGHGLVWNPPPFVPVEGYTCFSWVLALWATWSWFGVAPPVAANTLSVLLGLGQLAILAGAALAIRDSAGRRMPVGVGLVTLAVIVSNRTFLQWLTGGLETALFNCALFGWVVWAFRAPGASIGRAHDARYGARFFAVWSAAAALAALTRPDGLLLVLATGATATVLALRRERRVGALLIGLSPLLLVAAHTVWRRSFYGDWLPNTYYAKVVGAWPEAGVRYLASFAIEHGTWLLPIVALAWLVSRPWRSRTFVGQCWRRLPACAAVGAIVVHAGYYTLKVGGDHFEYRVLSQLVPLTALGVVAMVAGMTARPFWSVGVAIALGLAGGVGWVHFALTRDLPLHGVQPLAARVPAVVAPLFRTFDRLQAWLLLHNIGLRCQQQQMFVDNYRIQYPGRISVADADVPFPALEIGAVGVSGWCLHDCVILDTFGLNDSVVARWPEVRNKARAPAGLWAKLVRAADTNGDGWIVAEEIRAARTAGDPSTKGARDAAQLARLMIMLYADMRHDALTLAEAERGGEVIGVSRSMAHDRQPPPGYFEEFEPNVDVNRGEVTVAQRKEPLTAERIRDIERRWRARAGDWGR